MPASASSRLAKGAAIPSAARRATKSRRASAPVRTLSIQRRSSRSSVMRSCPLPVPLRCGSASGSSSSSSVAVPVLQLREVEVPAGHGRDQLQARPAYTRSADQRNDDVVVDRQVVEPDEQRRALDRIEFALGGLVGPVIFFIDPARDIAALPLVGLVRDLARLVLVHEAFRI